ncbi:Z-ring formation inhibitor MciZ [Paenibacillus pinistramenti]|uniref:Z-ring formation inhibitor MciZ n=1 Tax=Paenibacillus pinistramenti TaxID=1768003 RepID=UPI001108A14B|nr:Z-ring formation inhibitor MciZ [Paenibacillus pinistramenti]
MRSYYAKGQLRLTGKAWQIRHKLRQWRRETDQDMLLADWIAVQTLERPGS